MRAAQLRLQLLVLLAFLRQVVPAIPMWKEVSPTGVPAAESHAIGTRGDPNQWNKETANHPVINQILTALMLRGMIKSPANLVMSPKRKGTGHMFRMALL